MRMHSLLSRSLIVLLILCFSPFAAAEDRGTGKLVMTVLEIPDIQRGAGLAIILQLPSGKTVLYDTGSGYPDRSSPDGWASQSNVGRDAILPFLTKAGVKEIDTVFISHAHLDHFGGLLWLADNFPIKRLIDSGYHFPGQAPAAYTGELGMYDKVRDSFKTRNAYLEAHTGDQIKLDDDVSVEVLAPPKEFFTQAYAELRAKSDPPAHYLVNANSLGLRLTYGKITVLLPGDIQAEDQVRSLLPSLPSGKLKCDVLVAPGHGIHATKEFAEASKPQVTLCSVFPRYAKGLPARKIFAAVGSKVYVTGLHGQLQMICDGKSYTVNAERPNGRPDWQWQTAAYLKTLERPDGGYGWPDQDHSHLTPTWAAIGALRLLQELPPATQARIDYIRQNHPQRTKKPERELHEFDYQQIQALQWLSQQPGETFTNLAKEWTGPVPYMARYEVHSYGPFQQEVACLLSRKLLGLSTDLPAYAKYIESRRRENGSYNNTLPADDQSDGHVINTLWAIRGLQAMNRPIEHQQQLVDWLQSCQRKDGSFAPAPNATIGGKSNDVVFTFAALESLRLLKSQPRTRESTLAYLGSLRNPDGGFGDRPGWPSNSLATYYAIAALDALGALNEDLPAPKAVEKPEPLPEGMKLFTAQIQAPGAGSPADAVTLARALKIHLWGAKNSKPGWIETAQKLADEQHVPVKFFVANEEYNTFFVLPGQGTYSHLADIVAPAGADFGASMSGRKPPPTWREFAAQRLAPLEKAGGADIFQFNESETVARTLLDESIDSGHAFAAVSTFHFGNPDFVISNPWLWHYQHQLPMIALQDNHAAEPWFWADQLQGFRTFFIAREPTYEAFMDAMRHNRVVSVRHDETSNDKLWIHGGDSATRKFVAEQQPSWQWWTGEKVNAVEDRTTPLAAFAVLTPADTFEPGHPEAGKILRIRRRWHNTAQGQPKKPAAEIVELTIDGKKVELRLKRVPSQAKNAPAKVSDEYYVISVADLPAGRHEAVLTVKPMDQDDAKPSKLTYTFSK